MRSELNDILDEREYWRKRFADLVKSKRQERHVTLQDLMDQSGVDIATLSRVEHNKGEPTLRTASKICRTLGISSADLAAVLGVAESYVPRQIDGPGELDTLQLDDVMAFIRLYTIDRPRARQLLADLLNRVVDYQTPHAGGSDEHRAVLTPDHVKVLLEQWAVFRTEVVYPDIMSLELLADIYRAGGIITKADVSMYMQRVGKILHRQLNRRLLGILERIDIAARDRDVTALNRLKLFDVMAVDRALVAVGKPGIILEMYWAMLRYSEELGGRYFMLLVDTGLIVNTEMVFWPDGQVPADQPDFPPRNLETKFIATCRWLQQIHKGDMSWLRELRHNWQAS